jgi:glycosyltransferase involved in cell wall biosynthesis
MRVVHFVQRYPPALGGSEAFFARLSRYLASAGDSVSVRTTNAIDLESLWYRSRTTTQAGMTVEDGVEVRRYPIAHWPGRRYLLKALSLLPIRKWQCLTSPCNPIAPAMWCESAQQAPRVDVVHATAFPYAWPIICGLRLARRHGVPLVITPFVHVGNAQDPDDATRQQYLTPPLLWLLRQAACVLVQTKVEFNAVRAAGIEPQKLQLLGMGVAPEECTGGDRPRIRKEWNVGVDEIVIGHLANNSEEKGTVDLLQGAELAWKGGAEFRLVLAGPAMPNFLRIWDRYASSSRILRLGVLQPEQKRDFYSGIDVFALPSRSDSFGMVLLEAWANGVPNVAYRAGGVAEVIRHETDGLLVGCGDVNGLAYLLATLARDGDLRRRLGEAGRDRIPNEFQWSDKLNRVREVYKKLTGGRDHPEPPVR